MEKENNTIDFEDFKKVDLKVGKIISAENIKGYNKVLKILVDLGNEKREIISGISKYYSIESLINKYIIVCTNLEPKRFGEHISNGMILAAEEGDRPVLLTVFEQVKPGAQVL